MSRAVIVGRRGFTLAIGKIALQSSMQRFLTILESGIRSIFRSARIGAKVLTGFAIGRVSFLS